MRWDPISRLNLQPLCLQNLVLLVTIVLAVSIDADIVKNLLTNDHFIGDFTVFWTSPQLNPTQLYDPWIMTEAQRELVGGQAGLRPFVHPPSTLPWFIPFGQMPFVPALLSWVALGLTAYFLAARQYLRGRGLLLLTISPLIWISAGTGQLSLLLGALLMTAVAVLPTKPIVGGLLFGLAATVKPHVVLLVPLALVAAREWRALAAAVMAGGVIGLGCLAVQGQQLWIDWIEAAQLFPALIEAEGLAGSGITPSSLPMPDWAQPVVKALGALLGIGTVWITFRRTTDPANRLLALVVGCLLASPYGRKYDLVALQPAAILLLLDKRGGPWSWALGMIGTVGATQVWSVLAISLSLVTNRLRNLSSDGSGDDSASPMQRKVSSALSEQVAVGPRPTILPAEAQSSAVR